jgi:hypothetical protein
MVAPARSTWTEGMSESLRKGRRRVESTTTSWIGTIGCIASTCPPMVDAVGTKGPLTKDAKGLGRPDDLEWFGGPSTATPRHFYHCATAHVESHDEHFDRFCSDYFMLRSEFAAA